MTRFHPEIMPAAQQQVWSACAAPTSKWDAYLAGGTAIALYLGHRRSVDFDWFTQQTITPDALLADVQRMGFPLELQQNDEGTFLSTVSGVSFTVFRYRYPLLAPPVLLDGCRLASVRDLAAMKLLAVYQRGTKKDFIDVYALLHTGLLTLPQMLDAFREKFGVSDTREVLRALTYFGDADPLPMPHLLWPMTWSEVKSGVAQAATAITEPVSAHTKGGQRRTRSPRKQ